MKNNILLILAGLCVLALVPTAQAVSSINLSTFGSSVSADGWNWNSGTSSVSGSDAGGAAIAPNSFSPVDFTTLNNYAGNPANLRLELTGLVTTSPGGAFTITLEDNLGRTSATPFTWSSFGLSSSVVVNPVTVVSPFNWNNVSGWTLDAGGTGNPVAATFTSLQATAVPEPSTYALFAFGGLALGGYLIRRRRRA
jgi:hypothetical protein